MSMEWFRWYHGSVSDPKFAAVSRKAKQPKIAVLAVWAAILEYASQADERGEPRGTLRGLDYENIAACLDMKDEEVADILEALTAKGLIDNEWVIAWGKRQVFREREDNSRDRVRKHRAKKAGNAIVTPSNAPETPPERDTDTEKEKESTAVAVVADAVASPAATAPVSASSALHLVKPPCPHTAIVDLYHEILPELPACKILTNAREGYLKQRWNSKPGPSLDKWRTYFNYVRECPWLMGQVPGTNGRPPFVANLEWLTRPNNFAKVYEGKYETSTQEAAHG